MYVVLTRGWDESFYFCFENKEEAESSFKSNAHWYPNCWLIEGSVIDSKTYLESHKGGVPY